MDTIATFFGILGAACLILLSCFDAFTYSTAHWSFTVAFVVSIAISTVLSTQGVRRLEANHVGRNHLRQSAITKLVIVSLALCGAVVFAVSLYVALPTAVYPTSISLGLRIENSDAFAIQGSLSTSYTRRSTD